MIQDVTCRSNFWERLLLNYGKQHTQGVHHIHPLLMRFEALLDEGLQARIDMAVWRHFRACYHFTDDLKG